MSGVRGQLLVATLVVVGLAQSATPRSASAGNYDVVQCHPTYNRGTQDLRLSASPHFTFANQCAQAGPLSLDDSSTAARDDRIRLYWKAPGGTRLVGVTGRANLANDSGDRARIELPGDGAQNAVDLANGSNAGWQGFSWSGSNRDELDVELVCDPGMRPTCPRTGVAHTRVERLRFSLRGR